MYPCDVIILGCTLKPASNFSIAYAVYKESAKYGNAFSKCSSIYIYLCFGRVLSILLLKNR